MRKFRIPKDNTKISKTLRFDKEYVEAIQEIADKESISFNKVVSEMIKFALENKE